MATKVFQRGNFVIVEKDLKESIIPIDNFDYDFVTPTSVKLKDVQEQTSIDSSLADLQDEAGAPIGTISDVDTYFASFIKQSSAAPPVGGSTSANQDTIIDQTIAKKIGYILDLAGGTPPPYTDMVLFEQTIKGVVNSYQIANLSAQNTTKLAELFNSLQNDVFYGAYSPTQLYFVPVSCYLEDLTLIEYEDGNEGVQTFSTPWTATVDVMTGALHQAVELLQKQQQLLKQLLTVNPEKVETISLSYTGNATKNLTSDLDIDGKSIPSGSRGDIVRIFDLASGSVSYRFDGGVPDGEYPTISGAQPFNLLQNVNFDTFRIKGSANGSDYAIIINLYK